MTREMRFEIHEKDAGKPVLEFLAARFTYHCAEAWARLIAEGRVRVNGGVPDGRAALRAGDRLCYEAGEIPEPPVETGFTVLAEDALMAAIDKPGNLPCHPGGRYFNHTLWALLKARGGFPDPIFINRLDRETSGVVLVGKTKEAAQNLSKQFASHSVVKRYTVFVEGLFPERADAAGWLMPDSGSAVRKKRRFVPAAPGSACPAGAAWEWAETAFERTGAQDGMSVVTATPRTGRLHQIRATLLGLGYPVVGDKLYGVDENLFIRFCSDALTDSDLSRLRMGRQALHAGSLTFHHPRFGARTEITAPLPADMAALLGVAPAG
jgi:23S rRNA pseudouridine955/2504/2580 synthase/23S rRNA pseudouridine1911/1915/1917 synthase